ncbi:uncharacterized protein LOC134194848 isoform X1 [Corticium candelabrum]|uniref:uncharacterized protein LOC134194848 isoform X1 n=1 Tax=Corticium candelabrum TaxID=121492 RepID=UPI002E26EF00|nr:uncharacterized protein LOC134194848 isoform X1 [Corticium candelabrum]
MSEWDVQEDDVVENVMTALLTSVNMHQVENNADGNCLFEACSFLIYGSARYHFQVRAEAVRFIQENERLFKDAVLSVQDSTYNAKNQIEDQDATANDTTDFMKYVERMSTIGEWGDALCIEALAMVHKLQLSLFVSPACYRVEFNADDASTKRHIALANLNNRHFRAVLPDSVCDSHYKPHFPVPSVALNSVNEASVSNLTIHEYCSLLGRKVTPGNANYTDVNDSALSLFELRLLHSADSQVPLSFTAIKENPAAVREIANVYRKDTKIDYKSNTSTGRDCHHQAWKYDHRYRAYDYQDSRSDLFVVSPSIEAQVSEYLKASSGDSHETMAKIGKEILTKGDLDALRKPGPLSDTIINYIHKDFQDYVNDMRPRRILSLSSFVLPIFRKRGIAAFQWIKKLNVFHYELLAIPVYLTNHWIEVIIDIFHQAFLVFDSLGKKHEHVVFDLKLWITDVYHLVNGSILDVTDWSLVYPIPQNYPQQTDPFNCGIWTCVNMLSAAVDNPRVANNINPNDMRTWLLHRIVLTGAVERREQKDELHENDHDEDTHSSDCTIETETTIHQVIDLIEKCTKSDTKSKRYSPGEHLTDNDSITVSFKPGKVPFSIEGTTDPDRSSSYSPKRVQKRKLIKRDYDIRSSAKRKREQKINNSSDESDISETTEAIECTVDEIDGTLQYLEQNGYIRALLKACPVRSSRKSGRSLSLHDMRKGIQEAEHFLVGAKFSKAIQNKVKKFLKTWYFQNEVQPCKSHEIDDFMQWMGETGDWRYENKSMHAIYHILTYHHRRRWVTDEFHKKIEMNKK